MLNLVKFVQKYLYPINLNFRFFDLTNCFKKFVYHIEDIDSDLNQFTLSCRGSRATLKISFVDIFKYPKVIFNLSPVQSCIAGGYIGRSLNSNFDNKKFLKNANNLCFYLRDTSKAYKIVYENRNGTLGIFNKINNETFNADPVVLALNQFIINKFDASQAFYIGILAGIKVQKKLTANKLSCKSSFSSNNSQPKLYLVT